MVVLHGEQAEGMAAFEQAGWHMYPADDSIAERVINGFAA